MDEDYSSNISLNLSTDFFSSVLTKKKKGFRAEPREKEGNSSHGPDTSQSPIRRERQNSKRKRTEHTDNKQISKRKRTEHTDNRIIGKKSDIISSLFRKNPEIPTITSAAVETVKENVFTGQTFKDLPIHPFLVSNLEQKQGFTYLTEVQKKAIPALLNKKDALIRSQTGSGKTLAYAIPIVQSLQARKLRIQRDDGPYALVIVPTRELALQSYETFLKLLKTFIWIVPGCLMGGEKRKAEKSRLRKGVNILVATPGRLIDHIKTTQVLRLARIQWLVIDEADRMLELGYEKDMAQILNALRAQCTDPPQTVLLSATLSQGVERLSSISLTEPEHIDMNQQVARHSSHHNPGADPGANPGADQDFAVPSQLQQLFILTPCKLRLVTLAAFLLWKCRYSNPASKMIVFLSTQDSVQFHTKLFHKLLVRPKNTIDTSTTPELADGIQQNINFYQLYGDMPQRERQETFSKFSQAASGVLLCTDVAARGLDLPRVDWIVQYTPPGPVVDYVHRVGRTARAGTQGHSLLFLLPSEAAYIQELNKHKISLSQLQMSTVLQPLVANIKDLPQAGHVSAKHPSPRTQEEAATFLQDRFEELVLAHKTIHGLAGKGFQSFVKAYATLGRELKDIFKVNDLHLGHVAKSFALREAPTSVHSVAARSGADHKLAKRGKRPLTFRQATLSEYSDGLGNDKVMAKLGTKEPPKKKKRLSALSS
ncbi:probable ATP-dependent RNA helicase DDX31 [Physella acuta]|uniref:probable ATP-dependent RNA helicase DDX31 n=1 Tax=Physella acuta TaxID=109671 RepID=UPI0027DE610B|nr:probable ATP-dependent RNA helicase DDX31 [Physella acuta]